MALTPVTLTQAIVAAGISTLKGPQFLQIAKGVGNAVFSWIQSPTNVALSGVTTGQAGAGTVNGLVTVPAAIPVMINALSSAGLKGPNAVPLSTALSLGISASLSTANYSGVSVGVSVGSDTSKISVVNPITLIPLLLDSLASSMQGSGPSLGILSTGIANGVSQQLQAGFGTGVVVGVPTPIPAIISGTSPLSKVF